MSLIPNDKDFTEIIMDMLFWFWLIFFFAILVVVGIAAAHYIRSLV